MKLFIQDKSATVVEFLPDADEIERTPLPKSAQITLHVLLLTLATFTVWAIISQLDRVVTATGRLITPLPNIVVQPLETAIIQNIHVRIGQLVKKDQLLATLDPTFAVADEKQIKQQMDSLETQSKNLSAEIIGHASPTEAKKDTDSQLQAQLSTERQANYQAQLTKINENIARTQASLVTLRQDQKMLTDHLKPLQEIEAMQEKLVARNFGARIRLLEAQEKRQDVERNLHLAKNKEQEINRELAGMEAEKQIFQKSWRQKMMEDMLSINRDRNSLHEQLQKADKRSHLVQLTAPADSVVLELANLSVGSVIQGGSALFTLVPLNTELEAEVQIDAMDMGFIKAGDEARLKLDAFPFQKHGFLKGHIETISEDAFRRDTDSGQTTQAYYKSRIRIESLTLKKIPPQVRLLPGMTLIAEIVVGKRSVISYLLWPFAKAMDEAMEEP